MAEKRSYTIDSMRGVDLSSSPINVASSRASYMRNMISKAGVNHKRNGWKEVTNIEFVNNRLNGIFSYVKPNTKIKQFIVHAGNEFHCFDEKFENSYPINTSGINIADEKSKAYYRNELLWIIVGGEYLVYDGTRIQRVENSSYSYVPTTSIGITTVKEGSLLEPYEGVNLLNKKRKNKLIGNSKNIGNQVYLLDGKIDIAKPVYAEIEIYCDESLTLEENVFPAYLLLDEENSLVEENKYRGLVKIRYEFAFEFDEEGNLKESIITPTKTTCSCKYGEGTLRDEIGELNLVAHISNNDYKNRGEISMVNFPPPIEGESNITVEYTADYDVDVNFSKSTVVTQSNGKDVLIVSNDKNLIWFSDGTINEYPFGYIPVENLVILGSDKDPISAIISMADTTVGVFKDNSFYRVDFTSNVDSENQKIEIIPKVVETIDNAGCINQEVACNVNTDTLVLNKNGVFGVEYSSSTRSLKMRSSNVNKELNAYSSEDLKEAVACEHEGRYYLFIKNKVYIADSRYKVYENNRLDTSFEYEWWVWDNCPVRVVCSVDGKLYMGRENGTVAIFDNEFIDRSFSSYNNGDGNLTISAKDFEDSVEASLVTFNAELGIENGSVCTVKNAFSYIGVFNTTYSEDEKLVKAQISNSLIESGLIYIGMSVYFDSNEKLIPYEIIDIEIGNTFSYVCINASNCNEKEKLFKDISNQRYCVIDSCLLEEKIYKSISNYDSIPTPCFLCIARGEQAKVVLHKENNVECEYKTPVMSLGTELQTKTLWKVATTVSRETTGEVLLGYETNVNNRFSKKIIGVPFNFNDLNFTTLTFDGNTYKSYIKRVFERNFNYICFKFASKSNGDFAIENFSFIYSVNGVLKGDR